MIYKELWIYYKLECNKNANNDCNMLKKKIYFKLFSYLEHDKNDIIYDKINKY